MTDELKDKLVKILLLYSEYVKLDAGDARVGTVYLNTEDAIVQLEQAFKDAGWVIRSEGGVLMTEDKIAERLGLMSGQEFYDRLFENLPFADENAMFNWADVNRAAKRAAGLE